MNQELILILRALKKVKLYGDSDNQLHCFVIAMERKSNASLVDCYDVHCFNCPCRLITNDKVYSTVLINLPISIKEINE